jgi:hypothetical protein
MPCWEVWSSAACQVRPRSLTQSIQLMALQLTSWLIICWLDSSEDPRVCIAMLPISLFLPLRVICHV